MAFLCSHFFADVYVCVQVFSCFQAPAVQSLVSVFDVAGVLTGSHR